jgi:hypothetical protein
VNAMRDQIPQSASSDSGDEKVKEGARVHLMRTCPVCQLGHLRRIKREGWTARVPFSKYYSCSRCKAHFLRIFDSIEFKIKRADNKSRNRKTEFALVAFAIIIVVYACYRIVIWLYESKPQ